MIINEHLKDSASAAEDAAIAKMESMAVQTEKVVNKNQQAPFSYLEKCIALLKRYGISIKRLKNS